VRGFRGEKKGWACDPPERGKTGDYVQVSIRGTRATGGRVCEWKEWLVSPQGKRKKTEKRKILIGSGGCWHGKKPVRRIWEEGQIKYGRIRERE